MENYFLFLTEKKGDEGVNLSYWSLEELKYLVKEYIMAHPKIGENNIQTTPQIQEQNQIINQNINSNNNMNNNNNLNMNMNMNMGMNMNNNLINNNINTDNNTMTINNNMIQNNNVNNMNYNQEGGVNGEDESKDIYGLTNLDIVLCSVSEKSELSKYENIQIEMTMGEKVPGTFFSKAYMTYIITTSPLNFKVRRRYSDFEWLRSNLLNFYSSNVIPPIPKKNKLGGDRFDELFLVKRMRSLEKFLISLLNDPIIKYSQLLYDFLSIEEESKFNNKKKYYSNYKLPTNLRDFKSPNGKLDITINDEREIFYQNIKDNTELNEELLTKLNKNIKSLSFEMNTVFTRMDEISKICEDLFINSVKYYDVDNIKISYYQLKDMFKDWSSALKKQCVIVNVNIREYFKYIKNTFKSMKDMINIVDNYKINYYKSKRNLITKKEELFKRSDVSKWDLGPYKNINIVTLLKDKNVALPKMLYSETNAVNNMKQMYGYYLNRTTSEFERIRTINGFGHKQNVLDNAKKQITVISELFKNISDIAVSSPKYNIKNLEKEIENIISIEGKENENKQKP